MRINDDAYVFLDSAGTQPETGWRTILDGGGSLQLRDEAPDQNRPSFTLLHGYNPNRCVAHGVTTLTVRLVPSGDSPGPAYHAERIRGCDAFESGVAFAGEYPDASIEDAQFHTDVPENWDERTSFTVVKTLRLPAALGEVRERWHMRNHKGCLSVADERVEVVSPPGKETRFAGQFIRWVVQVGRATTLFLVEPDERWSAVALEPSGPVTDFALPTIAAGCDCYRPRCAPLP